MAAAVLAAGPPPALPFAAMAAAEQEQQHFYLLLGNLLSPDNAVRKQAEVPPAGRPGGAGRAGKGRAGRREAVGRRPSPTCEEGTVGGGRLWPLGAVGLGAAAVGREPARLRAPPLFPIPLFSLSGEVLTQNNAFYDQNQAVLSSFLSLFFNLFYFFFIFPPPGRLYQQKVCRRVA